MTSTKQSSDRPSSSRALAKDESVESASPGCCGPACDAQSTASSSAACNSPATSMGQKVQASPCRTASEEHGSSRKTSCGADAEQAGALEVCEHACASDASTSKTSRHAAPGSTNSDSTNSDSTTSDSTTSDSTTSDCTTPGTTASGTTASGTTGGAGCCGCSVGAASKSGKHSATRQESLASGLLLHIPAMDCPTEEGQIRGALKSLSGIRSIQFDLAARTVAVDADESAWDEIVDRIGKAGFTSRRLESPASVEQAAKAQRKEMARAFVALGIAVAAELVHLLFEGTMLWMAVGMLLAAVSIGLAGFSVLRKGFFAITHAQLNINALMSVAVTGAFVIGDWPEAAMVMALYSLAELIEARAVSRARNAIKGLLNLAPPTAEVRQSNGTWARVAANVVGVGAVVRVRPGERFAFDGVVLQGHSSADQSAITGESVPVEKSPADKVFAATVNQYGELIYEVQAPANDTVLARIIHVVEQAQSARAPIQRFVDKFAAVYTPAVFVIALLVAATGPLLLGHLWIDSIYKALVLLVIACPCALVISTPVTIVSGLTAAARQGVLIKGGVYLELAHRLKWVALDKTGTLTEGQPVLVAQRVFDSELDQRSVLRIALGLAERSDHPVSMAIARSLMADTAELDKRVSARTADRSAQDDSVFDDASVDQTTVRAFQAQPGRGVTAQVHGLQYRLGNHRWIHESGLCTPEVDAVLQEYEQRGHTVTLLASDKAVLAVFAVADTIRETSTQAVQHLQRMGIGVIMLTGDNALTARHIASQAGIREVRADLLPQDKLDTIRDLVSTGQKVAMVGDGINDSPALASADIGFAMGRVGSDIAVQAADVVIMNDDLRRIPRMIELSRRVHIILWQNISLALGIKLVFLLLAIFDHATMWMAVFADMGASLLVVFNGLRLLGDARKQPPDPGHGNHGLHRQPGHQDPEVAPHSHG